MFNSKISREKFVDILVNGLTLPDSAVSNADAVAFYFAALAEFINDADNDFWASLIEEDQIIISFGNIEYLKFVGHRNKILILTFANGYLDTSNVEPEEAKNIGNIVLGLIVFNDIWRETNGDNLNNDTPKPSLKCIYETKNTDKFDFSSLEKYNSERWKSKFDKNSKKMTIKEFYKIYDNFNKFNL